MALTRIPAELTNGEWGTRAFALSEKLGLDHNLLPQFSKVEQELTEEFFTVREEARKLLKVDRNDKAVKLIEDTFIKQFYKAKDFLKKIQ